MNSILKKKQLKKTRPTFLASVGAYWLWGWSLLLPADQNKSNLKNRDSGCKLCLHWIHAHPLANLVGTPRLRRYPMFLANVRTKLVIWTREIFRFSSSQETIRCWYKFTPEVWMYDRWTAIVRNILDCLSGKFSKDDDEVFWYAQTARFALSRINFLLSVNHVAIGGCEARTADAMGEEQTNR